MKGTVMRLSGLLVLVVSVLQSGVTQGETTGSLYLASTNNNDISQNRTSATTSADPLEIALADKGSDTVTPEPVRGASISTTAGLKTGETPLPVKATGVYEDNVDLDNGAEGGPADVDEPATIDRKGPVTLLLGRAVNASAGTDEQWVTAVIETALEFKLAAIADINLVNSDTIRKYLPAHADFSVIPEDSDYLDVGKKVKADYIGVQKFEVGRDKSVFYYMEIMSVKTREVVSTVERTFKIKRLGAELDEVVTMILKDFKVTPPRELARFLKVPVVGEDLRAGKILGDCIVRDRFSTVVDSVKLAADYRTICEREQNMPIAYYRAGYFFLALGKYSDAAEAFNLLFLGFPEYTPVYIPLAKAFRKAKRQQDAVRIALLGEKRGIADAELISERALSFLEMGKPNEAEDAYKRILAKDPENPYALAFYARLNNDAKNPKEALIYVDKLLKLKAQLGSAYLEMGRSLILMNRAADAVGALTKAVAALPNEIEPVLLLGDAHLAAKQYKEALALFENAIQKAGDNIDLYLKAAFAADKSGDPQKALSILKSVEQKFSNHGGLQKEMGLLELSNGDSANARIHLEAGMRAGAEDERVITGLGWIYVNAGEYDKAATMFTKALLITSDKNSCKIGLAMVYIKKGETRRAVALIEEVSSAKISIPGLNGMLGDAMVAKGEKTSALVYYRKERSLGTSDKILQGKIAQLSFELEVPNTARAEYERLVKIDGGSTTAFYRLTVLSLKLKDATAAQGYLDKAIKSGDTDDATWYEIGNGYSGLGMSSRALEAYNRSVQKNPSNEAVWKAIIALQQKSGNDSATAESNMKLYSVNNKYSSNLADAGRLFEKTGQLEKAKKAYSTFLSNKHEDADVRIRLAMLEYAAKKYSAVIPLLQPVPALTLGTKYGKVLIECYVNEKQHAKALPLIEYVLGRLPKDVETIEWAAMAYEAGKQPADAIKMYQKYLLIVGKHQEYAYHVGELLEQTGKAEAALAQYKANIRLYPADSRNYSRLAAMYVEAKEWKSAVTMLEKMLTFEAASPKILGLLAKANMELGNKKEAMGYLRNYIKSAPNDSAAWYELGMLYYNSKEFANAAKSLERAAQLIKRPSLEIYTLIGKSYLTTGDTALATGFFENARNVDKNDKEVVRTLVRCYRFAKDQRLLLGALSDLLRMEPENDDVRIEIAGMYLAELKYTEAAKLFEEALQKKTCDVSLRLKLAAVYEKQNDQKKWLFHLQAASKCNPKDAELLFQIGRYYFEKQNKLQAERYLKKALMINKEMATANYMLGSMLLERKVYKSAGAFLSRAVAAESSNLDYRVLLAEAFYKQERYDDAFKVIGPVAGSDKIRPDALRMIGLLYKALGNPDTAKQILENALLVEKNCTECYLALGDLYFDEADFQNAATRYQRAFDNAGYSKEAALRLAHCYMKMDKVDNARELYERVISQNPGEGEALFRLISIYLSKKMTGPARTVLTKNGYNKNGWYYLSEAVVAEAENNINAAMIAYANALKLIPEVTEVQAGCGRLSLVKKKYPAAIKYFGLAMGGDPNNVDLMYGMAQAYAGSGDFPTALELFQEVLRQRPDYPGAHLMMAKIYSKKKEHEMAISILEEGARIDKRSYMLYFILGREYQVTGNTAAAIDNFSKAIKIDEQKGLEAYRYIGNIYYKDGNEKKAKKYYATYIRLGGKNKKIQRYMSAN